MTLSLKLKTSLSNFFSLIKILQTGLLVLTGVAGAVSTSGVQPSPQLLSVLAGSLFLAVSGCTILNMVYDRDIDLKMTRTSARPIPSGEVSASIGILFGGFLTISGILWAIFIQPAYGWIVTAGVFFDVVIYTIWLRRRTALSVLLGGLSGGMPILAGRVLSTGHIDLEGLVLCAAILVWIPIHTMTLHLKYQKDFDAAGIPTFSGKFGEPAARILITISAFLSAAGMVLSGWLLHLGFGYLVILTSVGVILIFVLLFSLFQNNFLQTKFLFRTASLFMLVSMVLIILGRL
jgi:protoheme IX farnesyltransferase